MKMLLAICLSAGLMFLTLACKKKESTSYVPVEPITSRYYVLDIQQGIPRPGLTLLSADSYQQTTEYTCGPSAVVTLLRYYGRNGDEMTIASEMGSSPTNGTNPEQMTGWLADNGFQAEWSEKGSLEMIRENLANKIPVLVEWIDWGGHWVVAIGYDTRNTSDPMDDVIIFADPYDRHDDNPDGITWFNAQRFYYMWFDAIYFGRLMMRIYIVATPHIPS